VATVRPNLARQVGFHLNGSDVLLDLVGFDPTDPASGPTLMVSGSRDVGTSGVVVDRVFASQQGVQVGDRLTLNGVRLRVTGISSGGDMVMYQSAFAALPTARRVLGMPADDQALLVTVQPGARLDTVAAAVTAAVPDVIVLSTDELVAANQKPLNDSFVPIIGVLVVIGFLVGVTVIGLTTYSAVLERRREYGVLTAVGARPRQMLGLVLTQALLASAIGYVAGVGLAFGVGRAAAAWVPQFVIRIQGGDLAATAVVALAMAAVAAVLPLTRITRIEPGEVFRA
jgi:putative ABC transport system permease protein